MELCKYDLDHNVSEYLGYIVLCSNKSLVNLYKYVCRLYSVSRDFRIIVNNILLKDDYILKNLLLYIVKYDIKINIYSNYFTNIFEEWNMEKMERDNIYLTITSMKNDKYNIFRSSNKEYINTLYNYKVCTYGNYFIDKYDKLGKIKDVNIAMSYIKDTTHKIYLKDCSSELWDFSIDENFELFCYAIDKHITTLNDYIKLNYENIRLSNNQLKHLILRYPNLYNSLHTKLYIPRLDLNIKLSDFIINSKLIYNDFIIKKSKFSSDRIKRGLMLDNLIKINDDYNFNNNNDNNVIYNKNYIYFMLCYMCDNCNLIDEIVDRLKDNMLFISCYNDLKKYITSNKNIPNPQDHYMLFCSKRKIIDNNYREVDRIRKIDIFYRNINFKYNLKENIIVMEEKNDINNFMNLLNEQVFLRNSGDFWCLNDLLFADITPRRGYIAEIPKTKLLSDENIKNILIKLGWVYKRGSVFNITYELFFRIKNMFSHNLAELEYKENIVKQKLD